MPYTQTTLQQFINRISLLLDDVTAVYWTQTEIQYFTYEALRVWGALTNYWRTRGTFQLTPGLLGTPYVNLAQALPALRTRTYTLDQMVREIQYMLLEAPNGLAGTGMSGQIKVNTILNAIQDARNRFVNDTHLPYTVLTAPTTLTPGGMATFEQNVAYVHKAMWQDQQPGGQVGGVWTNLWREDEWAADHAFYMWPNTAGTPEAFSEAANAPLSLQVIPPPINSGSLELLAVLSVTVDTSNQNSTFFVPDEWVHAIKYAALSIILDSSSQIADPMRAQYCEQRYQQSITAATSMGGSIIRSITSGDNPIPLPVDTMMNVDAGNPYWRNQVGPPLSFGVAYDFLLVNPAFQDKVYGIAADVVQTAPQPQLSEFINIGQEDLEAIEKYVLHILSFKCGGTDFKDTMTGYDEFMKAVARRKAINAAKIRYLAPMFQQPHKEWQQRPDKLEMQNA